jgi:phosphonatase-like hydrolase
MSVRLVVLDLAGTTIRDSAIVATAFVNALSEQGVHVTDAELAAVRGASKRQAIAALIPEGPDHTHRATAAYGAFRQHLAAAFAGGLHAIEGVEAMFSELRSRSIRLALNTGFERDIAQPLVRALHWDDGRVDTVVYGDDVSVGRPAPFLIFHAMEATGVTSVHDVANVGDTVLDLHAGHNAGVGWNIGVLTGAHGRDTLLRAPHTHLLATVAELPRLFAAV